MDAGSQLLWQFPPRRVEAEVIRSKTSAHPQGENFLSTGSTSEGFPSLGGWTSYALGTENQDLPAFVAIPDPRGLPRSARNNWGNGFLPALFQGTDFSVVHPPANLRRPGSISLAADRRASRMLARLNEKHLRSAPGDGDLAARIASYELAGRMQTSIPSLTSLDSEPEHVIRSSGADSKNEIKRGYIDEMGILDAAWTSDEVVDHYRRTQGLHWCGCALRLFRRRRSDQLARNVQRSKVPTGRAPCPTAQPAGGEAPGGLAPSV